MKHFFILSLLLVFALSNAQVGVNTTNPQAALDITSTNAGLLIPRVSLASTADVVTVTTPDGLQVEEGTLVFNDGNGVLQPAGFYYWNGVEWLQFQKTEVQVHTGKFRITGSGSLSISGLPFQPETIRFETYANIEDYTLNSDNGVGNGVRTYQNYFGYSYGYAKNEGGSILQQVVHGGASAASLNNHSRYASSTRCIGMRYADQDGVSLGLTTASLTSFNADGFTLNVDNFTDGLVVIYTAYKP